MRYDAHLRMASGAGRLVRTRNRCLFIPAIDDADDDLLDHFITIFTRPDGSDTDIADFVLARTTTAPAFVAVSWEGAASGRSRLQLIVRGDVTVTTDLPSVPSLSGLGSSTWVEHHVPHRPDSAEICVGSDVADFSDLTSGIAAADGFRLLLTANATAPSDDAWAPDGAASEAAPTRVAEPPTPVAETPRQKTRPKADAPDVAPTAKNEPTTAPTEVATTAPTAKPDDSPRSALFIGDEPVVAAPAGDATAGLDRLAALHAASGGELPSERPAVDVSAGPASPTGPSRSAAPTRGAAEATGPDVDERPPPQRPDFGAGASAGDGSSDAEVTLHPDSSDDPFDLSDGTPLTDARLCPEGHHNPPHLLRCRSCHRSLDPSSVTVTVEQPVLGLAELADGTTIELIGTVLLGRNPKLDAVESTTPDRLVRIEAPSSVSRSHVLIVASGWTLTAIDCGSRAGTALLAADETDPIALDAWTPHELAGGDTLYLGGPTTITIKEVPA